MGIDAASFRDPEGFVFYHDNKVYRGITNPDVPILSAQYSEFFSTAIAQKFLVPFSHCDSSPDEAEILRGEITSTIELEQLDCVSYPYEWSYGQLKKAALLTLDISILALRHGLTVKDASAFNIQFHKGEPIFIDHLSFVKSTGVLPWAAYSQFCRHFLYPLTVGAYRSFHVNGLFRNFLDGLDSQMAVDLLPARAMLRPYILLHVFLHNRFIKKHAMSTRPSVRPGKESLQAPFLQHLRAFLYGLKAGYAKSQWSDYYNDHNYDEHTEALKKDWVKNIFRREQYPVVWDIGANDGTYSRLISKYVDQVVSMDADHVAIELNDKRNTEFNIKNVIPLVIDITNPSPMGGFALQERKSLRGRSKPDVLVLLALVHHLCITANIPLRRLVEYLAEYACDVLIEFVDRGDSQVTKLLEQKALPYLEYNKQSFEAEFTRCFELEQQCRLGNSERILYLFGYRK